MSSLINICFVLLLKDMLVVQEAVSPGANSPAAKHQEDERMFMSSDDEDQDEKVSLESCISFC